LLSVALLCVALLSVALVVDCCHGLSVSDVYLCVFFFVVWLSTCLSMAVAPVHIDWVFVFVFY